MPYEGETRPSNTRAGRRDACPSTTPALESVMELCEPGQRWMDIVPIQRMLPIFID